MPNEEYLDKDGLPIIGKRLYSFEHPHFVKNGPLYVETAHEPEGDHWLVSFFYGSDFAQIISGNSKLLKRVSKDEVLKAGKQGLEKRFDNISEHDFIPNSS